MVVNYKIRAFDWLTFALTIVNFNHVFIQPAPDSNTNTGFDQSEHHVIYMFFYKTISLLKTLKQP